jgi:3-oxoadipate enol-lactonase
VSETPIERADLGDVVLAYAVAGDPNAPRLLCVSGTGSDLRRPPTALDSPFVEHFHVLTYDHRGLGRSSPGPGGSTMADFANDLLRLLDHVGWQRCLAVGVSFGGMVLQEAAVSAPARFERLVLACTSAGGAGGRSYPLHELVDLPPEERMERWLDALDTRNTDPARRAFVRQFLEATDIARTRSPHTPGEVAQLEARRAHDTFDRLPRLTVPVLVAAGRYDAIAAPDNVRALASQLPQGHIEWFEGGHAFFLEDERAYPTMIEFLRPD